MSPQMSQQEKIERGSKDSGRYFKYMADFVGFGQADIDAIIESRLIIEKHIPAIVAKFYDHLLHYPPTRKYFLNSDGSINYGYLQLRMQHLANFWRRTASGIYDDDYARYVDYVGRAHTSHGADPKIYIPERYVIGQVGFIQNAITEALIKELHEYDLDLEVRAVRGWNKLMMVILELLARAYGEEHEVETFQAPEAVDSGSVFQLSVEAYETGLGIQRPVETETILVAREDELPEGERKIISYGNDTIGVFHHKGKWYALRNSCLHRGGPVAAGTLDGDILACPWHGYQYNITNGQLLYDPSASLKMYLVVIQDGGVYIEVPSANGSITTDQPVEPPVQKAVPPALEEGQFRLKEVPPGGMKLIDLDGDSIVVYNVDGDYYATQKDCTHSGGPLNEGDLEGDQITCPWHGSCFVVTNGEVCGGPARQPLETFQVVLDGETARVERKA